MLKYRFAPLCLALMGATCLSGCLGKDPSLEQQIQEQDLQIRQLQPAQADTWNQLQAMRQELNEVKGQLDDLKQAGGARALVQRVNKHEQALHQIESSMAMNFNLGESASVAQPAQVAEKPAATPGSYGEPLVAGAAAPVAAQTNAPSESTWGQASPQKPTAAAAPQKDISLALYDAGLNAYNSRNYKEAQRSFSDFLKNYGTHELVPDAQYYLAECYFQRNQFSDAALAYNEVITKHAKSSRAAGAYLKQGICFSKSGQKAAAQARMQELIRKYPKSPEAARAKNFLKTNS